MKNPTTKKERIKYKQEVKSKIVINHRKKIKEYPDKWTKEKVQMEV